MSTKLTLLVVIPLALTLAVTLPLTVTGLNQLASVTSTERLEDEILLVDEHLKLFGDDLERVAEELSENLVLLEAVKNSDSLTVRSVLHQSRMGYSLQHLEVVDRSGLNLGHEHQIGMDVDQEKLNELKALGMSELQTTKTVQTPAGWFLVSVRPLKDESNFIGSIAVGKLIDSDALAAMNFGRSDPILALLNNDDGAASVSYQSSDPATHFPIIPDHEYVEAARSGNVVIGTAIIDGNKLTTAYVPVALGNGSRSVFLVSLTKSPVVGLRDSLIANHVMVTAALSLLVLGVGYMVTRAITRKILRIRDGAVEIGNGNLSFRIDENTNDEMGTLAHEFNQMSDRLKEKNNQLEQANRDLEDRVVERTKELQQANVQLLAAQSQLVRTEKFGALGELSAGVAHDLRNPLGAIRNGIFFLKSRLAKTGHINSEPRVNEYITVMDERITQCDKIIENLISFTRISVPTYEAVNLRTTMESTLSGIDIPERVKVINKIGNRPLEVQADSVQLGRVFTNLIVNANEAMVDGGELTISAVILGQDAEVTFADSGPGMGPEDLEKIFEPLYTTKIQGTGLGLAVCQQVLTKHNGRMSVHSKPGVGTTFIVRLPLTTKEAIPK
ncbi:MAG: HAMP domain-containing protein [Chloroflexi bacterium]|nr:HAMP domain-containing protein [Chloroflexota bacterium]